MTNLTTPTFPAVVFSVTDAGIAELEAKHRGLVVAHGDKKGYLALTQAIANAPAAFATATAERLSQAIEKAEAMEISIADYEEFTQQATDAKAAAIAALNDLLTARIAADEAEAARLAEQARIDAERKAESERLAAEQARLAAERAEFDRQQAEARRQQAEADRARREAEAAEKSKREAEARAQQEEIDRQRAELKAAQDALAEQQRQAAEAAQREADTMARKEAEKAAKAAKAKLDAEIEAARPDRERMIAYVHQCLENVPEVSTELGGLYAQDVREALEYLLTGWKADVKEAA